MTALAPPPTLSLKFTKMHGLGNDFVIVDCRDDSVVRPSVDQIIHLGDRKTGIGCDQFITLLPPQSQSADVYMVIANAADGIEVEACGNATRCVAAMMMAENGTSSVSIETVAGLLHCRAMSDDLTSIQVDMGPPVLGDGAHDLYGHTGHVVDVGNPHIVFFVDDVMGIDLESIGPKIEHHDLFPGRTNVEFSQVLDETTVRMRVWERGEGITQACGTGACAVAAAAIHKGLMPKDSPINIVMDGGVLNIEQRSEDEHILMSGPVAFVFSGQTI